MNYWLIVTSKENFKLDREKIGFKMQGIPIRYKKSLQKMEKRDKVAYYIMGLQKFGAIATITGDYFEDHSKLWTNDDEMWPARRPSHPDIVLEDDELLDAKKLVPNLSFIEKKSIGEYIYRAV